MVKLQQAATFELTVELLLKTAVYLTLTDNKASSI
jgi:hypothetical protein